MTLFYYGIKRLQPEGVFGMNENRLSTRTWQDSLQAYRPMEPIKPRTDEDIAVQVGKLLGQLTIDQKIGS